MRDFNNWLEGFKESIADYKYYSDFPKIHENVKTILVELNILNSLIGSKNIEEDFKSLITEYPKTLNCVPLLLAVRASEIYADGYNYSFNSRNYDLEQYVIFMKETGLFDLLQNHIISNLVDYVTGVETGLDSNARKNRGGHLMEDLLEKYIVEAGFIKEKDYFKEVKINEIENRFNLDLSAISNMGKTVKRFDFVIYKNNTVYAIETNFYASSGSKLNETARSYKQIALEADSIQDFEFVWFTDGKGWISARNNLRETFDVMKHLYCIKDLEDDILKTF